MCASQDNKKEIRIMDKLAEFLDKVMVDETASAEFGAAISDEKERELTDDELNEITGGAKFPKDWGNEESIKSEYDRRYKWILSIYRDYRTADNALNEMVENYMEMCSIYKRVGVKYGLTNPDELLPSEVISAFSPELPAFWSKYWR